MSTFINMSIRKDREWFLLTEGNILIGTLLDDYNDGFINYMDTGEIIRKQINIRDITDVYISRDIRIDTYISSLDVVGVPVTNVRDIEVRNRVLYKELWDLKLQADRGSLLLEGGGGDLVQNSPRPDIVLRPTEDFINTFSTLNDKLLFTVNGKVYPHVLSDNKFFIPKTIQTLDSSSNSHIGVIDFTALGGYTKLNILAENITIVRRNDGETNISIDLLETLTEFTVIPVIDGNMSIFDGSFRITGNNSLSMVLNHVKLINRSAKIDPSELPWVSQANITGKGFTVSSVDPVELLTADNSFLILIPTESLSLETSYLGRTGIPGHYTLAKYPKGILRLSNGKIGNYVITAGNGYELEIKTSIPEFVNLLSDTIDYTEPHGVNNVGSLVKPVDLTSTLLDLYTI